MSTKPAWATEEVQGQVELHSKILSIHVRKKFQSPCSALSLSLLQGFWVMEVEVVLTDQRW